MLYLWRASWQAGVLALLVIALRWAMGRRLSPRWRGGLWMLVLLRLALPALPPSPWSLFNLVPAVQSHVPAEFQWPVEAIIVHIAPSGPISSIPKQVINWTTVLMEIWLVGAGSLALWTVFVNLRFARRIRRCSEPAAETMVLLAELGRQMQVGRLPRVVMTDALGTPALFGLFRPRLLLPVDLFQRLTDAEARFVLLHELAHVRRRDLVVGWIGCGLRVVHWFNPVIWISFACQRTDAESACDEMVLSIMESDRRREYGHTLLKLAARFSPGIPVSALGMVDGKGQLRERLVQIAGFRRRALRWSVMGALLLMIVGWLGLTDAHKLSAQPAAEDLVARRYEVQDIVFAMGIPGDGTTTKPAASRDPVVRASNLVAMIREAVPDEAWTSTIDADHFKTVGITITALPATQAEVEKVIERMRADTTVQVSVETRIFELDSKDVQKLSFAVPVDAGGSMALILSDAQVKEMIRMVQSDKDASSITAPRLTLWNHQVARVDVTTMQAYVADVVFSTAPNGDVSSSPQVKNVPQLSIKLEVHPTVSEDHQTVALDAHLDYSKLLRMDEQKNYRGHPGATVQIPLESMVSVSTKVSLKSGQSALLAGVGNKNSDKVLLLAIKATVHEK